MLGRKGPREMQYLIISKMCFLKPKDFRTKERMVGNILVEMKEVGIIILKGRIWVYEVVVIPVFSTKPGELRLFTTK